MLLILLVISSLFFCHISNPSPSAGRVRGPRGSTYLSPIHALHFGLANWFSTPAPRQLTTNKFSRLRLGLYSFCFSRKSRFPFFLAEKTAAKKKGQKKQSKSRFSQNSAGFSEDIA